MEDIIKKINEKGQQIRQAELDKDSEMRKSIENYYNAAKKLSGRINKLWDICQALLDNGFKLGKPSYHGRSEYYEFETEGWYHWLGFELRHDRKVVAFGVHGGGCCGRSVFINRKGEIGKFNDNDIWIKDDIDDDCYISRGDNYAPKSGKTYQDPDFTEKLKTIVNKFDDFESRLIEYANEITKQ